jgi:hypothetical protein
MSLFSKLLGQDTPDSEKQAKKLYEQYSKPELESRLQLLNQLKPLFDAMLSGNEAALPAYLRTPKSDYDLPLQAWKTARTQELNKSLAGRGLLLPGTTSSAELGGLTGLESAYVGEKANADRSRQTDIMTKLAGLYQMLQSASPGQASMPYQQMFQQQADAERARNSAALNTIAQAAGMAFGVPVPSMPTKPSGSGGGTDWSSIFNGGSYDPTAYTPKPDPNALFGR